MSSSSAAAWVVMGAGLVSPAGAVPAGAMTDAGTCSPSQPRHSGGMCHPARSAPSSSRTTIARCGEVVSTTCTSTDPSSRASPRVARARRSAGGVFTTSEIRAPGAVSGSSEPSGV